MDKEIENISHLQEAINKEDLSKAVRAIDNASEILIVGTRSTAPLAYHFSFGLAKLGKRVVRITAITTETYDLINRLDRRALVIVIGFPRYLKRVGRPSHLLERKEVKNAYNYGQPVFTSYWGYPFILRGGINFFHGFSWGSHGSDQYAHH